MKIDLTTFVGLAIIEKKNILFIDATDKIWWKIEGSTCETNEEFAETCWIMYKNDYTHCTYGKFELPHKQTAEKYMRTYKQVENITRNYIIKMGQKHETIKKS